MEVEKNVPENILKKRNRDKKLKEATDKARAERR